jgi:hypothetical protein
MDADIMGVMSDEAHATEAPTPVNPVSPRIPKPAGFDDRELCGAPLQGGGTCPNPTATCTKHCGAWARRKGTACPAPPCRGARRCYHHGGRAPIGPAAPGYIDGRSKRSKFLPSVVAKRYQEHLDDPELLSARSTVALLDARLDELCQRLDDVAAGQLLHDIRSTWQSLDAAIMAGNGDLVRNLREQMKRLVERGATAEQQWLEIRAVIRDRNTAARAEWERMESLHQVMTLEQGLALIGAILGAVRRHVPDQDARKKIMDEANQYVNLPDRQQEAG